MSAESALKKFCEREANKLSRKPRKNKKPEFEFKKLALEWLADKGFTVDVVESKAVYNFAAGRYDHGQAEAGFSDIVGVTPYFGVACYIELKAPGKRRTLKSHQREFLIKKINAGAFCCCTDSLGYLDSIYKRWRGQREKKHFDLSKECLIAELPEAKIKGDSFSELLRDDE